MLCNTHGWHRCSTLPYRNNPNLLWPTIKLYFILTIYHHPFPIHSSSHYGRHFIIDVAMIMILWRIRRPITFCYLLLFLIVTAVIYSLHTASAFTTTQLQSSSRIPVSTRRKHLQLDRRRKQPSSSPSCLYYDVNHVTSESSFYISAAQSVVEAAATAGEGVVLKDYTESAASLFNNMKLPAAVVTAGMISLGFATRFPELPSDSLDKVYPTNIRQRVTKLDRLHIVLGLISVTSELIVVLWAAVEVNQLTERAHLPAYSGKLHVFIIRLGYILLCINHCGFTFF